MKIGYVHSTPFPSVDANMVQVVQMCRAFSECGHEVVLFIPRAEKFASDAEALSAAREMYGKDLTFVVQFVPAFRVCGRFEILGTVRGTLTALKKNKPDLIYSRNPWTVLFLPRTKIRYVFEVHEEHVHVRSPLLDRFLRRIIVRNSRRSSCVQVVAISAALQKIWEEYGVPREKLMSAHDAVDISLFDPNANKADARAKLKIAAKYPVVVYTGALKPDRGADMMLAAAQAIPGMELYLVGGKDHEIAYVKNECARLGLSNVHLAGRVPHREIPLWLAAADILLMMWTWKVPTIRGCSPMKMFEYMAAKRLIVGPAFPTIEEVLENGKDSILFEPDNLAGMISALRSALERLSDPHLPQAAREKVERDYTWHVRAENILREIERQL